MGWEGEIEDVEDEIPHIDGGAGERGDRPFRRRLRFQFHKSVVAKYQAMEFPLEANDLNQLGEPDFEALARDDKFRDIAVYRVKVLPTDATDQRVYRLHVFLPSGPALWVQRERERFGKKFSEDERVLTPTETQSLMNAIESSGVMKTDGRCPQLEKARTEGDARKRSVTLDGVMLTFDMVIRGKTVFSECAVGVASPVSNVAQAFSVMAGEPIYRE